MISSAALLVSPRSARFALGAETAVRKSAPTLSPPVPPVLNPTLAPTATSGAPVAQVALVEPATDTAAGEHKVTFAWQVVAQPLAPDQCTELIFWDPDNSTDQRSPVGTGKEAQKRVAFDLLATGADPLLRTLTQARRTFHWGVRIVSCADPQVVLRDVEEVRAYTYQP